jgi:hypothetical protein
MGKLNVPVCVLVNGSNTGVPGCTFAPDKIVGAILVDKSYKIADADIPNIVAKLQEACLAAGKNRAYPIFRFEEIADNSEDETLSTLGYGSKQITKDGTYDWSFRMTNGLCFHNHLRGFNLADKKVFFIDSNNYIFGTKVDGGMMGVSMDFFYAKPFKINDGSNATIFQVRFAMGKPSELNEFVAFVKSDVDVENNVKGIIDLELVKLAVVAGKVTVGIQTACDKADLYESMADLFADALVWRCTKAGANVVITGVVKNAAAKGWDVSFVGDGDHVVSLVDAAALAAKNIGGAPDNGYEGNSLAVTMPA